MFLTRKHLDRRTFLRGMGTAIALPYLDAMVPAGRLWRDPMREPGRTRGQTSLLMFRAYSQAGMTPLAILRAATVNAAELLGWQDRVGAIEPGKFAELIAVPGDPLKDISALQRVVFVMKGGRVYKNVAP